MTDCFLVRQRSPADSFFRTFLKEKRTDQVFRLRCRGQLEHCIALIFQRSIDIDFQRFHCHLQRLQWSRIVAVRLLQHISGCSRPDQASSNGMVHQCVRLSLWPSAQHCCQSVRFKAFASGDFIDYSQLESSFRRELAPRQDHR